MATRRVSDSQQPPRPVPPPAARPAKKPSTVTAPETLTAGSVPPGKSRKRRAAAKTGQTVIAATAAPAVTEDQRRGMIALSAYLRAERRGFSPEGQAEDWLAAEQEVDALLNSGHTAPQ